MIIVFNKDESTRQHSNVQALLECFFRHGLAPISTDYLEPSYDQLCVELYQGSVTQKDARFKGFDLVTSIEL